MNNGWISIHRKMIDWEWYGDSNVFRLFMHLLLKVNHKDKKWRGIIIKSGSHMTGRKILSAELNLSEQQIRTALNKLKSTNDITIQATKDYSMISITNWDSYQGINQQITNEQPTSNQRATTNNNVNNDNNINNKDIPDKPRRKIFKKPTLEEVAEYCEERNNQVNAEQWIDHYSSNGWKVGKNSMKDWKASVRTWEKNNHGTRTGQQSGQAAPRNPDNAATRMHKRNKQAFTEAIAEESSNRDFQQVTGEIYP